MSDPSTEQEPTMEEILSSIRQIISDDDEGGAAEAAAEPEADDDDAAEEVVEDDDDDFELPEIDEIEEPEPEPELEPEPEPEIEDDEPDFDDEPEEEPVALAAVEEDDDEEEAAPADDALDLTNMVQDDGSVVELDEDGNPLHAAEPEPEPEPAPAEPSADDFQAALDQAVGPAVHHDSMLHDATTNAAASAFAHLSSAATAVRGQPLGDPGRTLEDLVKELLRPMLKAWLDKNLPSVVERIVEKEIAKIAHGADK